MPTSLRFRRCNVDRIDLPLTGKTGLKRGLLIMTGMEKHRTGNRKAYAAHRWCEAIDRLLNADSIMEKEQAVRWSNAWSTAYLGRSERRNGNVGHGLGMLERRRRNRFQT